MANIMQIEKKTGFENKKKLYFCSKTVNDTEK
jgi:hypothetical protein